MTKVIKLRESDIQRIVKRVINEDYNKKVWEFRISYNNAKDNLEEIFNDIMDTDEVTDPNKAKDIIIDLLQQVYDEYVEDNDEGNNYTHQFKW